MKLFECEVCGNPIYFENVRCLGCGHQVGYLPEENRMVAVLPDGAGWRAAAEASAGSDVVTSANRWRFCRNWEINACNWLVQAEDDEGAFCTACTHNRTVPDLSEQENHARWQKIESAKRRLMYTILQLSLPHPVLGSGHPEPLVFDFLAEDPGNTERVLTGHADGVVTIALAEADDATREKMKSDMGEAYRTLLGHFRHEVGHYYWDILVRDGGQLESFRSLFGDDREDYGAALERHYQEGAPLNWEEAHVSPYAAMHAWEDWAETWAHYLHMVDTLETASSLGIKIAPKAGAVLATNTNFDPYHPSSCEELLAVWAPVSVALNMLSRSMGQADLYPFVLSQPVRRKLAYVHDLIHHQPSGAHVN